MVQVQLEFLLTMRIRLMPLSECLKLFGRRLVEKFGLYLDVEEIEIVASVLRWERLLKRLQIKL